ncbi:MAG TPA: VCBS repeat-containing protein [Bacteroidales bacterium]|nr:VCBS repeat-containing protein [Bacteroidales bacterium]
MRILLSILTLSLLVSCSESTRFTVIDSQTTGIKFRNDIVETDSLNVMQYEYIYNGAGTGAGDLNNDGLTDIVFAGNQVKPAVYINEGNFKFKDITKNLGVIPDQWYSSVSLADVNCDGRLDIFMASTSDGDSIKSKDRLWINNGSDEGKYPEFTEMAEEYGIADEGPATNAAFFDYDLDGDLDLYILINTVTTRMMTNYKGKITDGSAANNDRLYRNNGDGTFTDVTVQSGIVYEGYGLGLAIGDVNKDMYPDIYVSNDFMSNDLLYINQGNGTFKNEIAAYISYQSKSSMGNDMADVNNDGNLDIMTLDMMPEKYSKKKQTINGFSYIFYVNDETYGYEHQYLRNMLHLNNGFINGKMLPFSEVGQMMGIYQTDWSWSPLFADYDNDGDKDLIVSNGFPKDMTDKDWTRLKVKSAGFYASDNTLIEMAPSVKIPNIAFENAGELKFIRKHDWLPEVPSYSYGAAFVDLDNDGDLDYVVNNINDEAFVLRNNTVEREGDKANYIRIKLEGSGMNINGIGAKVAIWCKGGLQYAENFLTRGYASSVDPVVHFGIGENKLIDSLKVIWPGSGNVTFVTNVSPNQTIILSEKNSVKSENQTGNQVLSELLFTRDTTMLDYVHKQKDFIDYSLPQKIIPHKFSQIGPRMAKGDIDDDGAEDLIVGSTNLIATKVFLRKDNKFVETNFDGLSTQKSFSEADLAIIDIDNDGDNDVASVAGGYDDKDQEVYKHYIYENRESKFIRKDLPVPAFPASVIRPCDIDHNGKIDLFIGSRVKNFMYPYSTYSWLIRNEDRLIADSTSRLDLGMVTDAIWKDFDGDGWEDLIVTREWNSIAFLKNVNGDKLVPQIIPGIEEHTGFWYSVAAGDFDRDGDLDFIAGNIGENTRFTVNEKNPMNLYAYDFEMDGVIDPLITAWWVDDEGIMKEYPVNYLDELWSQSPFFESRIKNYTSFSHMTVDDLFSLNKNIQKTLQFSLSANTLASYILWNENGSFKWEKLPAELQISPITKMIVEDINRDEYPDVILGGNDYSYDVPTGYYDANKGFVLINNCKGKTAFRFLPPSESGILLQGMLESLLYFKGDPAVIVAGFNRAGAGVYQIKEIK